MLDLVPFTEDDIDRLIGWIPSEEALLLWTADSFGFPLTRDHLLGHMRASAERGDRLLFKAVDRESGEAVGHIELGAIDRRNRSLRIGRVLVDPSLRGRGLGDAMMRAALSQAFDEMEMHRVDLWVFEENARAITCYERVGFWRDGLIREAFRVGEEYWSFLVMSVLEEEWAAVVG